MRAFICTLMTVWALALPALADTPQTLPTGQTITPTAAPGAHFQPLVTGIGPHPTYVADGAAAMATSPNGRFMVLLTSGYNHYNGADGKIVPEQSGQYIFVYALGRKGAVLQHVFTVPNAFSGLAWQPNSRGFFIGGGVDDKVYPFALTGGEFRAGTAISLRHTAGIGADVKPQAAGVAVSPDGQMLLVANYYNDSVSLIYLKSGQVAAEQDLRPGKIDAAQSGTPGGEFPFAITWRDNGHAYVSAPRDRQIVTLDIGKGITVRGRIATIGEPTALLIDAKTHRLYATEDNDDRLAMVDMRNDHLIAEPRLGFPDTIDSHEAEKGVNPDALALLSGGRLLIPFGGINALAVVTPGANGATVDGLIPTGWYPSAVATDRAGQRFFVANRKSPPGPNPQGCQPKVAITKAQPNACGSANQYIYQLEKAGLLDLPRPAPRTLAKLTLQVADNTGLTRSADRARAEAVMAAVRQRIKHVVFIIKENRTYDQVLGDLEVGNGDPHLAILGRGITPTHHALARQFVDFDNFLDSGEQSSTGWTWSTAGRVTDLLEKTAPVNYAGRGLSYESEGLDRNINVALPINDRAKTDGHVTDDPDVLPGPLHETSPDPDDDDKPGQGYLWNAAVRKGLSLRNYGMANDAIYDDDNPHAPPLTREAFKDKAIVFAATDRDLQTRSDLYFRGFDQNFPDFWNVREWMREFDAQDASNTMPTLTLMRLSHDHFGSFKTAIDGVNTVEAEMADNDYAIGLVVERINHSHFKGDTLIFIIEDDAQNGADHVDARRSVAFVVGPYVRKHAVVSTRYTTVSLLRTIDDVLGLKPMGLNDALATPMSDAFDLNQADWSFTAVASPVLKATKLPIPDAAFAPQAAQACPLRSSDYWAEAMRGQDFHLEDRLDTPRFNAALWQGLGTGPEPTTRDGGDLRSDRPALLQKAALEAHCPE